MQALSELDARMTRIEDLMHTLVGLTALSMMDASERPEHDALEPDLQSIVAAAPLPWVIGADDGDR
jgi:hypothetical protein